MCCAGESAVALPVIHRCLLVSDFVRYTGYYRPFQEIHILLMLFFSWHFMRSRWYSQQMKHGSIQYICGLKADDHNSTGGCLGDMKKKLYNNLVYHRDTYNGVNYVPKMD